MPKIEFRGQTYNDELEMPYEIRQAYIKEKERRKADAVDPEWLVDYKATKSKRK